MKSNFLLGWLLSLMTATVAMGDMSTPLTSLGNANAHGKLQLWINIDEADYGNDLRLPVRITFESGDAYQSKILGRGFWFPLMEARAYPYTDRLMQVELLCGKTIFLRKDLKHPEQYYTPDKKNTGVLDGNRFTLKQDDGWELRYKDGKIWQAQTEQGRVLTWYYLNGVATEIKEERSGNSAIKLMQGTNGKINSVSVNGRAYGLKLGKKPRVEYIDNQKVVGAMDDSLNVWEYPDGKKDTYEFAVTKELEPTLTVTNKDGASALYQWDAKSGFIVSDGDWKYKIERNGQLPKLRRYNDKGQEEFRIVDNRNGVVEQKDIEEGTRITETFKTPGPLYGKVRKMESVGLDGIKKIIYQAAYDEKGRLIREVDEEGYITAIQYDNRGAILKRVKSLPKNSEFLATLKKEEDRLLNGIRSAGNDKMRDIYLEELGYWYLHKMLNSQKAQALIPQIKNRMKMFNLKRRVILLDTQVNSMERKQRLEKLKDEFADLYEANKNSGNTFWQR